MPWWSPPSSLERSNPNQASRRQTRPRPPPQLGLSMDDDVNDEEQDGIVLDVCAAVRLRTQSSEAYCRQRASTAVSSSTPSNSATGNNGNVTASSSPVKQWENVNWSITYSSDDDSSSSSSAGGNALRRRSSEPSLDSLLQQQQQQLSFSSSPHHPEIPCTVTSLVSASDPVSATITATPTSTSMMMISTCSSPRRRSQSMAVYGSDDEDVHNNNIINARRVLNYVSVDDIAGGGHDGDDDSHSTLDSHNHHRQRGRSSSYYTSTTSSSCHWTPFRALALLFFIATYTIFGMQSPAESLPQANQAVEMALPSSPSDGGGTDYEKRIEPLLRGGAGSPGARLNFENQPPPPLLVQRQEGQAVSSSGAVAGVTDGGSSSAEAAASVSKNSISRGQFRMVHAVRSPEATLTFKRGVRRFYQQDGFQNSTTNPFYYVAVLAAVLLWAAKEVRRRGQSVCEL